MARRILGGDEGKAIGIAEEVPRGAPGAVPEGAIAPALRELNITTSPEHRDPRANTTKTRSQINTSTSH